MSVLFLQPIFFISMSERLTFNKSERLCGKTQIDRLFTEGKSVSCFPLRAVYRLCPSEEESDIVVLFSVPKRRLRKAVCRNRVKRQLRDMYRHSRESLRLSLPDSGVELHLAFVFCDVSLWPGQPLSQRFDRIVEKLNERLCQESKA